MRKIGIILLGLLAVGILAIGVIIAVPSLRHTVMFQIDKLRVQAQYAISPPQEAVFVPESELATMVQAT
ncbi:MAG: hypothetical protein ACYC6H_09755, partial [Bellilinea sp.]